MRPKVDYRSDSREAYEIYKSRHSTKVDFKTWKKIIVDYNTALAEHIMTSGDKVDLPHGLGTTYIQKSKTRVSTFVVSGKEILIGVPDWKATREAGKMVWAKNNHTDGYVARFKWLPHTARFIHKEHYRLRYSKCVKRRLGALLKSENSAIYMDRYLEKIN